MNTTNASKPIERDIFSVIEEIETARKQHEVVNTTPDNTKVPDPKELLQSLQKKAQLLNLIDGYANPKDVTAMKSQLKDAIDFLEQIASENEVASEPVDHA